MAWAGRDPRQAPPLCPRPRPTGPAPPPRPRPPRDLALAAWAAPQPPFPLSPGEGPEEPGRPAQGLAEPPSLGVRPRVPCSPSLLPLSFPPPRPRFPRSPFPCFLPLTWQVVPGLSVSWPLPPPPRPSSRPVPRSTLPPGLPRVGGRRGPGVCQGERCAGSGRPEHRALASKVWWSWVGDAQGGLSDSGVRAGRYLELSSGGCGRDCAPGSTCL